MGDDGVEVDGRRRHEPPFGLEGVEPEVEDLGDGEGGIQRDRCLWRDSRCSTGCGHDAAVRNEV